MDNRRIIDYLLIFFIESTTLQRWILGTQSLQLRFRLESNGCVFGTIINQTIMRLITTGVHVPLPIGIAPTLKTARFTEPLHVIFFLIADKNELQASVCRFFPNASDRFLRSILRICTGQRNFHP